MIDHKIKTFITLVATKSYTKTAEMLKMTQPAVTNQIKSLEDEYQVKIFYRERKFLSLTKEGEVLLKYAKKFVKMEEEIPAELTKSQDDIRTLSIAITPNMEENIFPSLLNTVIKNHPTLRLQLQVLPIADIYSKLRTYDLDLAIIDGKNSDIRFRSLRLKAEPFVLAIHQDHPLTQSSLIKLTDIKRIPLILRSKNMKSRYHFENLLQSESESIEHFSIKTEVDNVEIIKDLVNSQEGATVLSEKAFQFEKNIKILPLEGFNIVMESSIVFHREEQFLEDVATELVLAYEATEKEELTTK